MGLEVAKILFVLDCLLITYQKRAAMAGEARGERVLSPVVAETREPILRIQVLNGAWEGLASLMKTAF